VLVIATALVMLYAFVTTRTVIGRQIYAVGQPMLAPISGRRMMLHKSGVTHSLARFIAATQWVDIPAPVRHQAKRSFMNFFAVALAGCHTGPVEIALRSLAEFSGGRQATLVGRAERIDA
jgi:hypothetical protein